MLQYDFMVNAFLGGGIVAIVAGTVGFFLVMRGQAFAGFALSQVGFAGATGGALLGLPPLLGLASFTLGAGVGMGFIGEKLSGRDVAIGLVLAFSLGTGLLFLHFYTAFAAQANSVLFGNFFGITSGTLWTLLLLGILCLTALAAIARPLIFASLQPELAEAKGVPVRLVGIIFLAIVSIAVAESAQVVGVLLVFALLIGPAAAAHNLVSRLGPAIALSAALALGEAWLGLTLSYYTDWPSSFWITALAVTVFLASHSAPLRARLAKRVPSLLRRLGAPALAAIWEEVAGRAKLENWGIGRFLSEVSGAIRGRISAEGAAGQDGEAVSAPPRDWLAALLSRLGMPTLARLWAEVRLQAVAEGWGVRRSLAAFFDAVRVAERGEKNRVEFGLPAGKTLGTFDFATTPSVSRPEIEALASGGPWLEQRRNIVIIGGVGSGKTHLAAAIGDGLTRSGYKVAFERATDLAQHLLAAKSEHTLPQVYAGLKIIDCLIVDGLGPLAADPSESAVFFDLVGRFYESKSLIVTCHKPLDQWRDAYPDEAVAAAAVEQLTHQATALNVGTQSYRTANQREAGEPRL